MKKITLFMLFLLISTLSYSESKEERIRELMIMTGSGDVGIMIFDNMMNQFIAMFPDVPEEFWSEMSKFVNQNELIELIIPIYDKYFTANEIDELIDFYETDLGQKLIEKTPMITNDSMLIGQEWGTQLSEMILKKMQDDGFIET
jgi:hypothetical protein